MALTDADLKVYGSLVPSAVEFAVNMMQGSKQPRNNYKEFLQLWIIFLGETPPGQRTWRLCTKHDGWQKYCTLFKSTCFDINFI